MKPPAATVLSHFWAPLCAIGSHGPAGPNAQVCVSVFGASIVPERPRILVVLSNTNFTTGLVAASGTLSVSVLGETQAPRLAPLGLRSGRDGAKLTGLELEIDPFGNPLFSAGSAGWLSAEVLSTTSLGDSTAFLAAVRDHHDGTAPPLSWQAAKGIVGEDFLRRWAEKSAREQTAARETMLWRD